MTQFGPLAQELTDHRLQCEQGGLIVNLGAERIVPSVEVLRFTFTNMDAFAFREASWIVIRRSDRFAVTFRSRHI